MLRNGRIWWEGTVQVRLEGQDAETLLNRLAWAGIPLWNVQHVGRSVTVWMTIRGFRSMRPVKRRLDCRVTLLRRRGFPLLYRKLCWRKGLVLGIGLSVLTVIALLQCVWFVDIQTTKSISVGQIRQALQQEGLRVGAWKTQVDLTKLVQELYVRFPNIAWAGARLDGVRAYVAVVEKKIGRLAPQAPADLVARKAGTIQEIIALSGTPMVHSGDTVQEGEVLIAGQTQPTEIDNPESTTEEKKLQPGNPVRARGRVRAHVWYEGYGEQTLQESKTEKTGRTYQRSQYRCKGVVFTTRGHGKIPYTQYAVETHREILSPWKGFAWPVEHITQVFQETVTRRRTYTHTQAVSLATRKAKVSAGKTSSDTKIVQARATEIHAGDEGIVRIKWVVEAEEDIAVYQPLADS